MTLSSVILAGGMTLAAFAAVRAPAVVTLNVATIHAAALTRSRNASDSADMPFVLVSVVGPGSVQSSLRLPAATAFRVKLNEAIGTQPLTSFTLQPGDSVRVLLSLMEGERLAATDEAAASAAAAGALRAPTGTRAAVLGRALSPLTGQGANWLGSVAVLLTNEGGVTYWRAFECVATCSVLNAPAAAALAPATSQAAVAEFSGAGGTYHMQLQGTRAR
jgi:hypothetical protein